MTLDAPRIGLALCVVLAACGGAPPAKTTPAGSVPQNSDEVARQLFGAPGQALARERLTRIARMVRRLELDPFGEHGPGMRYLMASWVSASPDVHVTLCPFFMGASDDESEQLVEQALESASRADDPPAVLVFHYVLGMGAFQIEHPGSAPESPAVQVAGIESMLRVYEVALMRGITPPFQELEELRDIRDHQSLLRWYEQNVTCGADSEPQIVMR